MTPEERQALINRYVTKREDVSPEVWERGEETQRRMREKIERGEVLESWSKDNFPIGLHSETFEPLKPQAESNETPGQEQHTGKDQDE